MRDYNQISIGFNSFMRPWVGIARVKTPDGKVVSLAADAVQVQKSPADENFYQDSRQLTFSLPNLRPVPPLNFNTLGVK